MERKTEHGDLRVSNMYLLESRGECSVGDQPATSRTSRRGCSVWYQGEKAVQEKEIAPSLFAHTAHLYVTRMYVCIFSQTVFT